MRTTLKIAITVAGAGIGWLLSGPWGLAMGAFLAWAASRLAGARAHASHAQANHRPTGSRSGPASNHFAPGGSAPRDSARHRVARHRWQDRPPGEQLATAAKHERDGELQLARQIYWRLVEARYPHPAPYERLARSYEDEGNDRQLIYVLDRALEALREADSGVPVDGLPAPLNLQATLRSFEKRQQAAIDRNNDRYTV